MCFKRLSPLFKICMLLKYYCSVCRTLSSHSVPKWRAVSQYKDSFSRYGIPMLKIRRSRLAWRHLYIETARRLYHCWYICGSYKWGVMPIIATHFLCNTCKPSNDSPMTHDLYWPVIDQGSVVALIMQCYINPWMGALAIWVCCSRIPKYYMYLFLIKDYVYCSTYIQHSQ